MRRLALGLGVLLLVGCGARPEAKLLGHWTGAFVASKPSKQANFEGFLHLYRTSYLFKMEIKNDVQTLKVDGTWSESGDQIILTPHNFDSVQPTAEVVFAHKLTIYDMDTIAKQFGKQFALRASADVTQLKGPAFRLGPGEGHFEFSHIAQSTFATP